MNKLPLIVLAALLFACKGKPAAVHITKPVENIKPTPDQADRRIQSEAYCKAHAIPVYKNPYSLIVDAEDKVTIRSKNEVADRAIALLYLGLKSEGLEEELLEKLNHDFHISSKFSPAERLFATAKTPTKQQIIDANWRYEDLHVMLWALGFIDSLSYPDKLCDVAHDTKIIHELTEASFKQKAKLRSKKEILDQADLILQLDWACVDARTKNQPAPGKLDKGIVYERHYALNWLINYLQEDWDDVSTDT